ncbi:P-loop containing nucleoside triphosphate hydrolase protein [Coemansia spiralis]|nr:P-loop containing nucleoside triphosphate hydrolase protein [Coemansia spiralis]
MGAFRGLTNTAIGAMVLLVLYNGGRLVARGDMEPGDLMAFMLATQHAQRALDALGGLMGQSVRAKAAVARVFEVINLVPTIPHAGGARPASLQGNVRFMDVDFAYPSRPDAPVLRRFNLDVPQGQVVALCGASGSGKSTVAALLERFYDPTAGEIWLDACPLKHLDPKWHRSQIGFIPQDPALFSTSIRENLRLARPSATNKEIEDACRCANAHDFIASFPSGYDTIVGERGTLLSGGQKQRISIARAILRDPKILILDEATSSLDAESERMVQNALDKLMVGRTVLVIAHRLTTIKNADRIVVMGKVPGHIIEQGTHKELMDKRGAYFKLYNDMHSSLPDLLVDK